MEEILKEYIEKKNSLDRSRNELSTLAKKELKKKELSFMEKYKLYSSLPQDVFEHERFVVSSQDFPQTRKWLEDTEFCDRYQKITLGYISDEAEEDLKEIIKKGLDENLSEKDFYLIFPTRNQEDYSLTYKDFKIRIKAAKEWFEKGLGSFIFDW